MVREENAQAGNCANLYSAWLPKTELGARRGFMENAGCLVSTSRSKPYSAECAKRQEILNRPNDELRF
jgi:hypothetical protein